MADTKITGLTALTTPAAADLIAVVDDVVGTPTTKKVALSDLLTSYIEANISIQEANISDLGTYLTDIVSDTTPQLGGSLDVNGNSIVSTSNGNITLAPNGTGDVVLGNFTFDADQTVGAGQDNYVLTYDNGTGKISLEASAGGGGGLADVVDDTTPQLGGNLDVNGNKIVSVSNGNIDIEPNGTGNVLLGNFVFDADQTVGAGQDNYVLTYDNGTGLISLEAAAGGGGSPAGSSGDLQYNNGGSFGGSILKQGTNTIEQRDTTNAQIMHVYNTYTDASNYERLEVGYESGNAYIRHVAAGTGTPTRTLILGTTDTQNRIIIANSTTTFKVQNGDRVAISGGALAMRSSLAINWTSSTSPSGTADTGLVRNAAGVVRVTDGSSGTGQLIFVVPTSDPGITGALWNNGGTLAISA